MREALDHSDMPPDTRSRDAGDTYIEILIALVIVALVVAAMFNGLMSITRGSTVHRSTSNVDTLARSFAETAIQQIQQSSPAVFLDCASAAYYNGKVSWAPPSTYVGYSAPTITQVLDWNPVSSPPSFQSACKNSGLQQLQITAVAPDGSVAQVLAVVRNPSYSDNDYSCYANSTC